jgi:DNA-binding CsgD family transcriptional regulator/tetratricopeptide (TPR) repeat protein
MIVPVLSNRRLVGRDAELQLLGDLRRAASGGRPSVVLLGGEAGIGKTRLLTEFTAGLTGGRAPRYALGECLEDAPRPFGPFRAILARLVEVERQCLDAASPLVRRTLAALIPDALGLGDAAAATTVEKAELFAGVLGFLQLVAAARTTVLALEDIHWADSATLELLCHVAPRIGGMRLMIVATHRDSVSSEHPLFAPLGRLGRHDVVREIRLRPLADRDIRVLIGDALGKNYSLGPERLRSVVEGGEGNPFFTEEILKKVLEQDSDAATDALPISIRSTILARVAQLGPAEREVLDYAAVLGLRVDLEILSRIMERDKRAVERSLRRLRDVQLLVAGASNSDFRFRHAVTRQTIYDELLAVDAHDLHVQIVTTLETDFDPAEHLDELAYHAWKASLRQPTLRYSERAGDAALGLAAHVQAATYYQRALAVATDDETRIRLLDKAAQAYMHQSDFDRVIHTSMQLRAMLVARGDYDAAIRAVTRAAGEAANGGKPREGLAMIQTFSDEYGDRLGVAAADHMYASAGRLATACDDIGAARSLLARVRAPNAFAPFTHQVYWLAQMLCAEIEVDQHGWKEAVTALRAGNPHTYAMMRSQMLHQIATTSTVFGEHAEGERAVDEAIAIDREMGLAPMLAFAQAVKAGLLTVQGRLVEARHCVEAALAEPDAFPVRLELATAASAALLALDEKALFDRCLEENVLRGIRATGIPGAYAVALGMRGIGALAIGEAEAGRAMLREAIDDEHHQFAAVEMWPLAAPLLDDRRLQRIRDLCGRYAENPDYRVMHACAAWCDAIAARRAGSREATVLAEAAAERYRNLGWPLHEARALELAGRPEAALAIFRACGSVADTRRLDVGRPRLNPSRGGRLGLSAREREVASLIGKGLSNRAIAERLFVTQKTVEKHVSAIYAKLHLSTRTQLAAHIATEAAR